MTKREQDLLKRIDALERKVKELEARPATEFHYHYQQPYYFSYPQYPTYPVWSTVTGAIGGGISTTTSASVPYTLTS